MNNKPSRIFPGGAGSLVSTPKVLSASKVFPVVPQLGTIEKPVIVPDPWWAAQELTAKELYAMVNDPQNIALAAPMGQPGLNEFMARMELIYFPPIGPVNDQFQMVHLRWPDDSKLFTIYVVPNRYSALVSQVARECDLIIHDGFPWAIEARGATFFASDRERPTTPGVKVKARFPFRGANMRTLDVSERLTQNLMDDAANQEMLRAAVAVDMQKAATVMTAYRLRFADAIKQMQEIARRPDDLHPDDIAEWQRVKADPEHVAQMRDLLECDLLSHLFPLWQPPSMEEHELATLWLTRQLLARGCDRDLTRDIVVTNQQRMAALTGDVDTIWSVTRRTLHRFEQGGREKSGSALAERLFNHQMLRLSQKFGPPDAAAKQAAILWAKDYRREHGVEPPMFIEEKSELDAMLSDTAATDAPKANHPFVGNIGDKYRPLNWVGYFKKRYEGAYEQISAARLPKVTGSKNPPWPAWCFAPLEVTKHHIFTKFPILNSDNPERNDDVGRLAALAAWRMTKGVYRYHEAIFGPIWDTPVTSFPVEVLYRLPEWCVYIEVPPRPWLGYTLFGFFAFLEWNEAHQRAELRLIFDARISIEAKGRTFDSDYLVGQILHLVPDDKGMTTLGQGVRHALDVALASAAHPDARYKDAKADEPERAQTAREISEWLSGPMALLLYLCSSSAEINDAKNAARRPSNPEPRKIKGELKMFSADGETTWQVGYRLGTAMKGALAEAKAEEEAEIIRRRASGDRRPMRPHVRRGHLHTVLSGPRDRARIRDIRWFPPTSVKLGTIDDNSAVVHPVK